MILLYITLLGITCGIVGCFAVFVAIDTAPIDTYQ
jgi:hypothetical protein